MAVAHKGISAGAGERYVDRFDHRVVNLFTALGFGLPVICYFWVVGQYGVNVVVGDQYNDLTVIGKWYSHPFDWSVLWVQHNENRIFFPNLIVLVSARTDHFNIHTEEYVSALFLLVAIALIVVTHKLSSGATPWLYYCPVAFLLLSLVRISERSLGISDRLVPGAAVARSDPPASGQIHIDVADAHRGYSCRGCWKLFVPARSTDLARGSCPALPPSASSHDDGCLGSCSDSRRARLFPRVQGLRRLPALQNRVAAPFHCTQVLLFCCGRCPRPGSNQNPPGERSGNALRTGHRHHRRGHDPDMRCSPRSKGWRPNWQLH